MSQTRSLLVSTAAAAAASVLLGGVAAADPATPPIPVAGLPGLPAIEQLSPVIQQAASDPAGASSLLMAAAAAFAGNSAMPPDAKSLADSVTQFVQNPAGIPVAMPGAPTPHLPAAGALSDAPAHLPTGVDPANAVGPKPWAAPAPPEALPAPPEAAVHPEAAAPAPEPAAAAPDTGFAPDSPPTQDFLYPSIGQNCLADGGNSIATALSVAGPAAIPTPGPGPGQTAYVFTAIGTAGPAETQKLPLNVTWVNLSTGRSGTAALKPRTDINRDGPTTLTAIVDTGSGSIMSTIFGQVTTAERQCNFLPTIGSTVVP